MVQSISGIQVMPRMSKDEKFVDQTFATAQKEVKKSEVRDADWGLYAAQTCLAKQLVNASPEETELIKEKMNFIQAQMNDNLKQDSTIFINENASKLDKYAAKAQMYPGRVQLIKAGGDAAVNVLKGASGLVNDVKTFIPVETVPALNAAA
ncbi:hypothetical protein II906_03950 [bacterium]|nr:hypothetical protein [bacterium]